MTIIKLMSFEASSSFPRYLDDLHNIDNLYFKKMIGQIYPTKLLLNKANFFDTEAPTPHWTWTCP